MSSKMLAVLGVALCLAAGAHAATLKWTGYANNNQWDTPTNWYPAQVPSMNDDVTIDAGIVQVPNPASCQSLSMGTSFDNPANLTIFNTFIIGNGGMTVSGNGNVIVNAGTAAITGVVKMSGNLYFQSGSLSGQITINERGSADLTGAAQKTLTGCSFNSAGKMLISGTLVLTESSQLTVTSTVTASGNFGIQAGDGTAVLFDTSAGTLTYTGGGVFSVQARLALGAFNFIAGNMSIYSSVTFVNSFEVPSGSFVSALGMAVVNMTAGVTGAGVVSGASSQLLLGQANITGSVIVAGGNVTFTTPSTIASLTLNGGSLDAKAPTTAGKFVALSGGLKGTVTAATGMINSLGFDLSGSLTFTGAVSTSANTLIAFSSGSSLVLNSAAQLNAASGLQLVGAAGPSVKNDGVINAIGALSFQNINLQGKGNVTVAGTLQVSTNSISQNAIALSSGAVFKGANAQLEIAAVTGANVKAVIGAYTLNCGPSCNGVKTSDSPNVNFSFSA